MSTNDAALRGIKAKLAPSRWPNVSGRLFAIVGFVLDEPLTEPHLYDMSITSDGYVIGKDESMRDVWLATAAEIERNIDDMLADADLTYEELALWRRLWEDRVADCRREGRSLRTIRTTTDRAEARVREALRCRGVVDRTRWRLLPPEQAVGVPLKKLAPWLVGLSGRHPDLRVVEPSVFFAVMEV